MFINLIKQNRKTIYLIALIIVLICIPLFVKSSYYMHLLISTGINIILAMTFILIFRTGLISLAIAAFHAMGAYVSALLTMKLGLSFWIALPVSSLTTGIIALAIGYLLIKNTGFSFVILTAIIGMLIPVVIGNNEYLGGYQGIMNIPHPDPISIPFFPPVEFIAKTPNYYLLLALSVVIVLLFYGLYASRTGKAWMAIGLNPDLAKSLGINVFKYRLLAFVIASMVAGLVGSYYAHYIGILKPNAFTMFKTLYIHIYAILGGIDFAFLGPAVGSIILTFAPEVMRIFKQFEPLITGLIMILIIIFLPDGVLSLFGIKSRRQQYSRTLLRIRNSIKFKMFSKNG